MSQQVDQRARRWIGRMLIDLAGEPIGRVEDIYTDDVGGYPAWIAVGTGRFGLNIIFLPFAAAGPARGDELRVPFPSSLIKGAPSAGKGGRLTRDEVVRLYDHYGFDLEAEEVRERASHRRSSGLRADYKPASPYVPAPAKESRAPTFERAALALGPAPAVKQAAPAPTPAPAVKPAAAVAPAAPAPGPAPAVKPAAAGPAPAEKPAAAVEPGAPAPGPPPAVKAAAAVEPKAAPAEQPSAPAAEPSRRPTSPLFRDLVDLAEQSGFPPDSPVFWDHDDRIDSIRPPREPARSGRH